MTPAAHFVPFASVERGGVAESYHFGVGVLADRTGKLHASWGDPDFITFPRSALKPFQAVDLVENGAFDAFQAQAWSACSWWSLAISVGRRGFPMRKARAAASPAGRRESSNQAGTIGRTPCPSYSAAAG